MRPLAAEAIGTFFLVFAGTGTVIVNDLNGAAGLVGIALAFGLVVFTLIEAFGDVSGAHFNPAVTLGFCLAGRFPLRRVPGYVIGQCVGAFGASLLLKTLFRGHPTLGATGPSGPAWQSLIFEILMTAWLMIVILAVSTGSKEKGIVAGLAIGAAVALDVLFGGPVSGASMNPARSLAPALCAPWGHHLWIYLLGPLVGAGLAVLCFALVRGFRSPSGPGATTEGSSR